MSDNNDQRPPYPGGIPSQQAPVQPDARQPTAAQPAAAKDNSWYAAAQARAQARAAGDATRPNVVQPGVPAQPGATVQDAPRAAHAATRQPLGATQRQAHVPPVPPQAPGVPGPGAGAPELERPKRRHPAVKAALLGLLGGVVGAGALVAALHFAGVIGNNTTITTSGGGSSQSITINPSDDSTTLASAVAAKALPSVVSINVTTGDGEGVGSGVTLDADGNILTNYHVVEGAQTISVSAGGNSYDATVVGTDESSDLAVIKIDPGSNTLTPIEVGDSSALQVGDWVMSVGSPFGLEQSVSQGIVSALTRNELMQSSTGNTLYTNLIQVDAAINPGNSGGALVNDRGQLVGICTLYSSDTESFAGIGFAIPGNYAVDVAQKIVSGEQVTHAYIGLSMQTVNAQNAKANKLSVSQGAYVAEVTSGSPADEAGIQKGDIIVGIGGTQITSADGAILAVRSHSIGETVQVTVMRGNDQKTFDVTLGSDEELQRQQEEANSQPVSDINSYTNGNGNGSGQDNSQLLQQFQQWLQQQQEGYGYGQRQR